MKIELLNGQKNLEERIKIVASAGSLSHSEGTVFEVIENHPNYEENLKLIKRICNSGHNSIKEHDQLVFAISDVTPIIEQLLIGYRLAGFTIKSGRYVDFRDVGYYVPNFKDKENNILSNNEELKESYKKHVDSLFDVYEHYMDSGINKEDARFVLPYSFRTNIVMCVNARELEMIIKDFVYGKRSKYDEAREVGLRLLEIAQDFIPYYNFNKMGEDVVSKDWYDKYRCGINIKTFDKVNLINHTENVDLEIILSTIMYHEQCGKDRALKLIRDIENVHPKFMAEMMDDIKRCKEQREFEQVSFQFEIPISLIVLKHLTRHRMQSILIPEFTPMWNMENYQIPPTIKNFDVDLYNDTFKKNLKLYKEFKNKDIRDEDLIYFYQCGHYVNVITTMNGRMLEWFTRMRHCKRAQWEIRDIAEQMINQVTEVAPLYGSTLGATCETIGKCPEGKLTCGNPYPQKKIGGIK